MIPCLQALAGMQNCTAGIAGLQSICQAQCSQAQFMHDWKLPDVLKLRATSRHAKLASRALSTGKQDDEQRFTLLSKSLMVHSCKSVCTEAVFSLPARKGIKHTSLACLTPHTGTGMVGVHARGATLGFMQAVGPQARTAAYRAPTACCVSLS